MENGFRDGSDDRMADFRDRMCDGVAGLRDRGLLSPRVLAVGVPDRPDWDDATAEVRGLLDAEGRHLVEKLGYEIERLDDRYGDWADGVGVDWGPLDEDGKRKRIYELDAVVAHLYGLGREHLEVVFETFHDARDHEPRLRTVLEYYDEWAAKLA